MKFNHVLGHLHEIECLRGAQEKALTVWSVCGLKVSETSGAFSFLFHLQLKIAPGINEI